MIKVKVVSQANNPKLSKSFCMVETEKRSLFFRRASHLFLIIFSETETILSDSCFYSTNSPSSLFCCFFPSSYTNPLQGLGLCTTPPYRLLSPDFRYPSRTFSSFTCILLLLLLLSVMFLGSHDSLIALSYFMVWLHCALCFFSFKSS